MASEEQVLFRAIVGFPGDDAVNAVLNGAHWYLSELSLAFCDVIPDVVPVLARSPRLARLTYLDLRGNIGLGRRALLPLAESPYLSPLCRLDLERVRVDEAVCDAFRQRLGPRLLGVPS